MSKKEKGLMDMDNSLVIMGGKGVMEKYNKVCKNTNRYS